jgi:hypothetical protein
MRKIYYAQTCFDKVSRGTIWEEIQIHVSKAKSQHRQHPDYCLILLSTKNFSRDWDRVKGFSALVTPYLMIDLGSFLASHKSKIFLAMRGTTAPFKPSKQKEAHPPSGNPLMYLLDGGQRRKSAHFFLQHFSNLNMCLGPK